MDRIAEVRDTFQLQLTRESMLIHLPIEQISKALIKHYHMLLPILTSMNLG